MFEPDDSEPGCTDAMPIIMPRKTLTSKIDGNKVIITYYDEVDMSKQTGTFEETFKDEDERNDKLDIYKIEEKAERIIRMVESTHRFGSIGDQAGMRLAQQNIKDDAEAILEEIKKLRD